MIAKELDPPASSDPRLEARRTELEKIAAQLKSAFQHDPNSQVLNGLRLKFRDDFAKIDHLLVHPFGMILIGGKTLSGEIEITAEGQWIRHAEGKAYSILSPVSEAKMRGVLLKKLLQDAFPRIPFFRSNFVEVVIVLSGADEIVFPGGKPHAEICTLDQLPTRLRGIIAAKFSQAEDPEHVLDTSQIHRYSYYLCEQHLPETAEEVLAELPAPEAVAKPQEQMQIWKGLRKKEALPFGIQVPASSKRQRLALTLFIVALLCVGVYALTTLLMPAPAPAPKVEVVKKPPAPKAQAPKPAPRIEPPQPPAPVVPLDTLKLKLITELHLPKPVAKQEAAAVFEVDGIDDDKEKILRDLCARRPECR